MVQTAHRYVSNNDLSSLESLGFQLMIVDEAHHAPATSCISVMENLGFLPEAQGGKLLLGLTATAYRRDDLELGNVFRKAGQRA